MGGMFQRKLDDISKELPNVFGIADDILIVGYDNDMFFWGLLGS